MKDRNIIEKFRVWDNSDDIFEIVSLGKNQGTRVIISIPISKEKEESHV